MNEQNKATIRHFYEFWNTGKFDLLPEVLAEDAVFRGSFDIESKGPEAFREYADMMLEAFPNFQVVVDSILGEGSRVAVQLTTTGTHQGDIFGLPPTGRFVTYRSAAFLTLKDNKIIECQMIGDLVAMLDQLILESAGDAGDDEEDDDLSDHEAGNA